jgi:hypothetical protein
MPIISTPGMHQPPPGNQTTTTVTYSTKSFPVQKNSNYQNFQIEPPVTTETYRENNGDKIVTVTTRHATQSQSGRVVTTITTGIRSGFVKSETIEQEIPPLAVLAAENCSVGGVVNG